MTTGQGNCDPINMFKNVGFTRVLNHTDNYKTNDFVGSFLYWVLTQYLGTSQ